MLCPCHFVSLMFFVKPNAEPLPRRVSYFIWKRKCCAASTSCLLCFLLKQMLCPCHVMSLMLFFWTTTTCCVPATSCLLFAFLTVNAVPLPRHVSYVMFLKQTLCPCHVVSLIGCLKRKCCAAATSCLLCYVFKQMLCSCHVVSLIWFLKVNAVPLPRHVSYVFC